LAEAAWNGELAAVNSLNPPLGDHLSWAQQLAVLKPLEPALYEVAECVEFLQNWVGACGDTPRLLDALGPSAERFIEVVQYSLWDVVWREDLPLDLCESAIRESLRTLTALCQRSGQTVGTGSFWMVVVGRWRTAHGSATRHRLLPTVKRTLLEQVRASAGSPCLRDSAWEGIKLIDEELALEAKKIEREFQETNE